MTSRSIVLILSCVLACVDAVFGSAFAVNELGARAQGMGGAFASVADDASAIFFNPAGIAFLKGTNFQLDNLVVAGQFRFIPSEAPVGTVVPPKGFSGAISQPFIPIASLYMTHQLNDRWTLGFGAYTPFGLAANFTNFNDGDPPNTKYVGRFAGTRAKLEAYWFQPTLAVKLSANQSLALGVAYVHTHLFLEQSFLNPLEEPDDFGRRLAKDVFPGVDPNAAFRSFSRLLPEGRLRAAAVGNAPGFSAGYLYKHPGSGWNLGLMVRSAVVHHLKGKAAFSFTQGGALTPFLPKDKTLEKLFPNQAIKGTFTTPATYVVGVSNNRFFGSTISVDLRIQDFRRFKDLPLNFEKTVDEKGNELATSAEERLEFDFRNSYLLHVGIEKQTPDGWGPRMMRGLSRDTSVRGGYVFDYSPVVEKSVGPLFPDATRHSWTAGMTKRKGKVELTLFYQFMQFLNRTTNVPANRNVFTNGEYRNFAHLAGAGMRFRLGKQDQ